MRNECTQTIVEEAFSDERVIVLSGDLGNHLFDDLMKKKPKQFINCGIAEENLAGVAAGLALQGFKPITFSIAPFVTIRCLEQIRDNICYQHLPVTIIGNYGGLSYSRLGITHQSIDDISFLRTLANMVVICPCDEIETHCAIKAALSQNNPVYIRCGKKHEPSIHKEIPIFTIGKSITIKHGREICILNTGNTMALALVVAEELDNRSISTRVESFHTVKPLDQEALTEIFNTYPLVVTVEEHTLIGGFGSGVAEWIVDHPKIKHHNLLRFGLSDEYLFKVGTQDYLRSCSALDKEHIVHQIMQRLMLL